MRAADGRYPEGLGLVLALFSINLGLGTNEIVGLLGDNGAGKSMIAKIPTGVYSASAKLTSRERYVKLDESLAEQAAGRLKQFGRKVAK